MLNWRVQVSREVRVREGTNRELASGTIIANVGDMNRILGR